jgi:hypothetical protein
MSWTYWCPHCGSGLNPGKYIVLVGERGELRTLMGFHPQPGDYRACVPPGVELHHGETWEFFCPVCQRNLETEVAEGLCALDGRLWDQRHRVYFSPVVGEQATFVVTAEGLVESYGRDAGKHSLELLEHI